MCVVETQVPGGLERSGRRKSSPYFSSDKQKPNDEKEIEESSVKRRAQEGGRESNCELKTPIKKKLHKVDDNDDDDFVLPNSKRKGSVEVTPNKKSRSGLGRGVAKKSVDINESDEDNMDNTDTKSHSKSAGRGRGERTASLAPAGGRGMDIDESDEDNADDKDSKPVKYGGRGCGGRGASAAPAGGRGRGGSGRGGFMNFGERKDPPHKGEKVLYYLF